MVWNCLRQTSNGQVELARPLLVNHTAVGIMSSAPLLVGSSVNLSLLRVCLSVSDTLTFLLHCGFSYSPLLCLIVSLLLSHISFLILPITYYVSLFLSKCFSNNLSQLSRWFAVDCFFACLLYVSLIIHDHSLEFVVGLCACSGWVIFLNDL